MKFLLLMGSLAYGMLQCTIANAASGAYPTMDAAATAALHEIAPISAQTQNEYGGLIYQKDGNFFFTDAVTDNKSNEVSPHGKFPKSATFVGLYHTHPGHDETNELFSEADVATAKQLHVTSYILVIQSHTIRRFIPGEDKVQPRQYRGADLHVSTGTILASN